MEQIVQFFNEAGWLANLLGIGGSLVGASWFGIGFARPRLAASRIDKVIPLDFERKWNDSSAKEIARIAIVDDQPADFPTAELKSDGFQVQTYKQVTLSKTAQLATYDIVFLDMKGVVKDDPENGGMKLIAELRRLNPAQKICAVSSKTFDINATAFFRQADDAKKKPLTAHECRAVIKTFLNEQFSLQVLRDTAQEATKKLTRDRRVTVVQNLRKFSKGELTIDQLREVISKMASDANLTYRLTNIARAVAHAG